VYDYASKNLALVNAVDLRSQAAEKGVKSARGQLLPTLSLGGSVNTNYSSVATTSQLVSTTDVVTDSYVFQGAQKAFLYSPQSTFNNSRISYGSQLSNNIATSIGIGLNVPILNGFLYRSRLRQAKASNELAKFNTTTVRNQLKQAIEQDYVNMSSSFETYKTLSRQTEDFRQSFKAAEVKLDAGVLTTVDYVIVKNNFDRATINLIAAKYNYLLQTKILDYYMGRALF
jgi:outer membrane protein